MRSRRWLAIWCAALFATTIWRAAPQAQASAPRIDPLRPYRDAVTLYRNGRIAEAIQAALGWTDHDLTATQSAIASDADEGFVSGFALLLTEAARTLSSSDAHRLAVAEFILRNRPKGPGTVVFFARWYDLVASSYLSALKPDAASEILARAARSVSGDARLAYLRGLAKEVAAYLVDPSCPPPGCAFDGPRSREPALLRAAAEAFQEALAADEHLTIARLHLGRVLYLEKNGPGASVELQKVAKDSNEPTERYLALLFLGAIDVSAGNNTAAIGAYRMAIEAAPQYPVAHVALAWAEYTAGHRRSVDPQENLSDPRVPEDGDPWWAYQQPPPDHTALQWLRDHVGR